MAEKGDGTQDTVSLPPTYAPSETYTESPPPAYRGGRVGGGKLVQVVRLVCVTAVVLALLIGFFVLSSNYLKARTCSCEPRPLDTDEARAALLQAGFLQPPLPPSAQPLVKEEEVGKEGDVVGKEEEEHQQNGLDSGDDTVLVGVAPPPTEQQEVNVAVEEEVVEKEEEKEEEQQLEEEVVSRAEQEEVSALQDILAAQVDHMKKIRLPIDLIMGNPALAGREVSCEVERRQVPVAPGILSQTIFVTCHDNNDDDDNNNDNNDLQQQQQEGGDLPRPGPPLSLLAPIMKMLTSRPGPQPRLVPISLRGPIPFLPQPRPAMQHIALRNPFAMPLPLPPKARLTPMSVRGPISMMVPRPAPEDGPSDRMLPRHLQPIVRMTPRLLSVSRAEATPVSLAELQRGALPLPQARARAPPRPVSLSPFPPRQMPSFLPFNVLGDAAPRPATHMELSTPPRDAPAQEDPSLPRTEFGPPRGHTLISDAPQDQPRAPPRLITLPKAIRIHTLPRDALTPPGPVEVNPLDTPQPPSYAPEARRSPFPPEVNTEAEVIDSSDAAPLESGAPPTLAPHRKHHLLMVN